MVERECELARIRDALAQAAQGIGTVTVIESSAGTGRSRLLSAAAAEAAETDAQIMRGCGRDAERLFDFGLVLQLFEQRWLTADADEQDHMFRGPARPAQALTGAGARTTGAGASADVFSITHGLFCLTRNLTGSALADAGTRPLAVLVDDVQRADSASVRFLAYLGNRIRTLPVALVVTARAGEPATDTDAVRALRDAAAHRLHPAELSDGGARRVARMRLPDAEPELWDACADASGGNVFLLRAILDEISQANPAARSARGSTRRERARPRRRLDRCTAGQPPGCRQVRSRPPSPHLATLRRLRLRRRLRVSTLTRQPARLTPSPRSGFCARVPPSRSATGSWPARF